MKRKIFSILFALVLALSLSLVTAVPVGAVEPETVVLGGDVATAVNAQGSSDEQNIGSGSWQAIPNTKMELYIFPTMAPFDSLGSFTIADIDSISYVTKNSGTPANVDFGLNIYTVPYEGGDAGWYGNRLSAEPLYSYSYNPTIGEWNTWNTDSGDNQLQFFDSNHTVAGFYTGPTLTELQAGVIDWGTYPNSGSADTIDYSSQTVGSIVLITSTGGTWIDFAGFLDSITIELTTASLTIDLEEYYAEVWVDDVALPGHFVTIQAGINAVAEDGTVNVAAGDYNEMVTITKGLTLLGANAGRHPAVGTHPTETVGIRVEESILSHAGTHGVKLQADDITIDGFKFTGGGPKKISGYADSNNFHLTNCIFDNDEQAITAGVIEFSPGGSLSHTDMVFDFNLFQDKGDATIYAGGYCDRLRIAYNKFNVLGDSVFWANPVLALVDGIIEGNEFDGTIDDTPGTGFGTLNIGKGGNIIIRDNWFHDQQYNPLQVGIIGGSVTGNIFERIYPHAGGYPGDALQLWGGEWGTPVSTDVVIADNTIRYNDIAGASYPSHGIRLRPPEGNPGIDGSTIHIHLNNFEDGGARADAYAIRHQGEPGTVVDAENNWWNHASGPYHITNPDGQGGAVSDDVDFSPWFGNEAGTTIVELVTGTDPDPVILEEDGDIIATVDISGGDVPSGTIAAYSEPEDPTAGLFVGTDTTGVVFLDVQVTGYTEGMATITVPYPDDTPSDGIVDGTTDPPVYEHTLGLYYWEEWDEAGMWRLATNNVVDPDANTVSGDIPVSALTGTPIGLGGYEALVAIDSILNLSISGEDTVELTIKTNTASLGAATIDLMFDPSVVEVLGVNSSAFENLEVNLSYGFIGTDFQIARFLAYQTGAAGVDATEGAVVAEVQLKAVGSTMDVSPLRLEIITLKDNNLDRIPRTVGAPSFALVGGVGDANRDTYVDSDDLVEITRAILGFSGYSIDAPTMNVDGKDYVDAADCTYLARHLVEIPDHPLPPLGWTPPWAPPAPPAP